MKNFLKKYLSEEQLTDLEAKYKTENPEAKELPVYISKARLDEVLTQKKELETQLTTEKSGSAQALEQAKTDWETAKASEIETLKKDFNTTEAIYKAKGRNVKAIKALIDPEKKVDEEIARLVKDEAYLFQAEDSLPEGTGKKTETGKEDKDAEQRAMRLAVGLE